MPTSAWSAAASTSASSRTTSAPLPPSSSADGRAKGAAAFKTASPPRLDPVKLQTATRAVRQQRAGAPVCGRERRAAREQVAGARRRERAQDCLQKVDAGQRREGARLEHEGAARGDGRRDLEDRLEQRVVPGRHERGDARRVRRDAARGVEIVHGRGRRRARALFRGTVDHEARVVVEHVRAVGHVALGLRKRLRPRISRAPRRSSAQSRRAATRARSSSCRRCAARRRRPLERVAPRRAVAEVRARRMAPRRRGDRAPRVVGGRVRELGEDRAVGRAVRFYRCVVARRRARRRRRRASTSWRSGAMRMPRRRAVLRCILCLLCRSRGFELVFAHRAMDVQCSHDG